MQKFIFLGLLFLNVNVSYILDFSTDTVVYINAPTSFSLLSFF